MASLTFRFVGYTEKSLIGRIISAGEMGFWADHVECVLPDGTLLGAHESGGVLPRPAGYDKGQWDQELRVSVFVTDEQAAAFYAFLEAQIGKAYDLDAIKEMVIGTFTGTAPDWKLLDRWICSALQTAATITIGLFKSAPATVRLTTPRDFLYMLGALVAIGNPATSDTAA